ncbi:MAG: response regulator transcription factor [Rhodanobacteraceae bacterium]|nr:response regulator transcription factor [Rhodanobacteraceae bacterium]
MIHVAVIDDEPLARRGVIALLAGCADVRLAGEYSDGRSALEGLQAQPVDLALIDVQMPGLSGLDVLASLPESRRPLAVLLTAHEGFAVRAFALNAVDYLLKPIDERRFTEALQRVRHRLAWRGQAGSPPLPATEWRQRFAVRIGRRNVLVDIADVEWIGADGDYAVLHAGARSYVLRESLHRLATQLDPKRFVRVHRSVIVRLDRIAELQPTTNRDAMLRLHDGTPLRVSRTYVDVLLEGLFPERVMPR